MIQKAELRNEIAERRRYLESGWIAETSARIVITLQGLDSFKSSQTIALYKAISGEVDLDALFAVCWSLGKCVCIPVFNKTQMVYELAAITAETRFRKGNYGIQEPEHPSLIAIDQVDLMILPGVAFDPAGNRLGRGGGYYDRLMARYSGIAAAVAFDFQLFPSIPSDPHDIPVDFVITETKLLKVQNER